MGTRWRIKHTKKPSQIISLSPHLLLKIFTIIKLFVNVSQEKTALEPLFGHVGDEISKNRGTKVHWASRGHETQFSSKIGAMSTVAINVLEPPAFDPESQYFIPLFDEIS
jgi:hypothetical protein